MRALITKFFSNAVIPVIWTVILIILLCLPGSMMPGTGIFSIEHLDKVVHVILFGTNVVFWGWYFVNRSHPQSQNRIFLSAGFITIILGIVLEFVQLYFIPNRSFDGYDIVADAVGAAGGTFWLFKENS